MCEERTPGRDKHRHTAVRSPGNKNGWDYRWRRPWTEVQGNTYLAWWWAIRVGDGFCLPSPHRGTMSDGDGQAAAAQAACPENGSQKHPVAEILAEKKPYYAKRISQFELFHRREEDAVQAAMKANDVIDVILPDGQKVEGVRGVTTPMSVAAQVSKGLAKKAVVAKVDGAVWDMTRPLEGDCAVQILGFDSEEGKETFWHSSAHVLGQALELEFGVDLTIGPTVEEGFYYDCYMGDRTLGDADIPKVEKRMIEATKEGQPFQRVVVSRDEALTMFEENKFKIEIIQGLPEDATISLYRCGPMVDLCHGPHVPNTGLLKAMGITSWSRAFWRADVKREPLQRVYGVTYPDPKQLKDYRRRIEEAKKRDHRVLGTSQELFFFHPLSAGSCFFLPHGARIYNALVDFMREQYWDHRYEEVITPNIYNFDLWVQSGHAAHYRENMFGFEVEKAEFGLKPMNCPGHCLMFAHRNRSYRELPLRLADFGVLHRNEYSGALHGLTRVRKFSQDDAHIFCRPDQVMDEVLNFLKLLDQCYAVFGLEYALALSTRPKKALGDHSLWEKAESSLKAALNAAGKPWELNPEDGAFYGPKIDITVFDALRRKFQCATVQLDFQMPIKFNLSYTTETGQERPVMVHRAVLGSVERMLAILTENYAGKWPLWLSPRQVMVVPVSEATADYGIQIRDSFRAARFYVDIDLSGTTMKKKVRQAQLAQYNYILVVGEQEQINGTVNVRTRDNVVHGMHSVQEVIGILQDERKSRSLGAKFTKGEGGEGEGGEAPEAQKEAGEG
eukprot:evm.model.scf_474.4 EVM.evm.TU.scf_474.4   scf_474:55752-66411(-)